jgi:hypothetical protein
MQRFPPPAYVRDICSFQCGTTAHEQHRHAYSNGAYCVLAASQYKHTREMYHQPPTIFLGTYSLDQWYVHCGPRTRFTPLELLIRPAEIP